MLGAQGPSLPGLVEPSTRIDMVWFFSTELEALWNTHLSEAMMWEVVEVAFLTSRLHLWSFLLHDDVPRLLEIADLYNSAETDAATLILLASGKNLSRCPWHLARSVLFAALILLRILASPYARQPKVVIDQILLASRTLQTAVKVDDDHGQRWTRHLPLLVNLPDKKQTPRIRSRMVASLVFDTIRVMKEHVGFSSPNNPQSALDSNHESNSNRPCGDGPYWTSIPGTSNLLDLDGLDWDHIGGLL